MIYSGGISSLPTVAQVFIIIGIILASLYVLLAIYVVSRVTIFRGRIIKKRAGLAVLLSEERRLVTNFYNLIKSKEISLTEKEIVSFEQLFKINPARLGEKMMPIHFSRLSSCRKSILTITERANLRESDELVDMFDSFNTIDAEKRRLISLYNTDIGAYNYWVRVPYLRWLLWIFGTRVKNKV